MSSPAAIIVEKLPLLNFMEVKIHQTEWTDKPAKSGTYYFVGHLNWKDQTHLSKNLLRRIFLDVQISLDINTYEIEDIAVFEFANEEAFNLSRYEGKWLLIKNMPEFKTD